MEKIKLEENQFKKAIKEIKKYSTHSEKQIEKALYKLYDELNIEDPYNDWQWNYLTVNDGENIKELLTYYDGNQCIGIVVKSLRILKDEELEIEMGW